jgi:hypothetical protein
MARLFPQLMAEVARRSSSELALLSVQEATTRATAFTEDISSIAVFSATGGTRMTTADLRQFRNQLVSAARECGFPNIARREAMRFDARLAVLLREGMDITPMEASNVGIWEYLACVLMPDLVIWRFRDAEGRTSTDRFIAASRRNHFYRLWWRAFVLAGHLATAEAEQLLGFLGEDEMVQMMERPNLFGNLRLMRLFCTEFKRAVDAGEIKSKRADINRDVQKRLLRATAVAALESLSDSALRSEVLASLAVAQRNVR